MQDKTNVLDDHAIAARVGEPHLAEFKSLADRARRREGVRRRTNGWLHGEEVEQVFQEDCLLGDVVEAGEDLLNVGSGPIERPRQEGETAERNRARQSPRQDHYIGPVIPPGRHYVQGRTKECTPHRKYLIFVKDLCGYLIVMFR